MVFTVRTRHKPARGGTTTQPASGGTTTQPASNGTTTQPASKVTSDTVWIALIITFSVIIVGFIVAITVIVCKRKRAIAALHDKTVNVDDEIAKAYSTSADHMRLKL